MLVGVLRRADLVLIHERWEDSEGRARLGHNGDGHGSAHPILTILDLEVVQQRHQHTCMPLLCFS